MTKRRDKYDGEQTYLMMERVPLTNLASWQEEGIDRRRVIWVTADWGGGREINNEVKANSGSCFIELNLVPQTYLTDGADMSDSLRFDNLS
jgi:hypothetical protein